MVGNDAPSNSVKKGRKHNEFHAPSLDDQFKVAGGKAVTSLAAAKVQHSETEIKMAKVKALQDTKTQTEGE